MKSKTILTIAILIIFLLQSPLAAEKSSADFKEKPILYFSDDSEIYSKTFANISVDTLEKVEGEEIHARLTKENKILLSDNKGNILNGATIIINGKEIHIDDKGIISNEDDIKKFLESLTHPGPAIVGGETEPQPSTGCKETKIFGPLIYCNNICA